MRQGTIAMVVPLLLALTSCGGGTGAAREGADRTDGELLARASAALRTEPASQPGLDALAYSDLAAARKQLGLPADAQVSGKGRLLFSFATRPLFQFQPYSGTSRAWECSRGCSTAA